MEVNAPYLRLISSAEDQKICTRYSTYTCGPRARPHGVTSERRQRTAAGNALYGARLLRLEAVRVIFEECASRWARRPAALDVVAKAALLADGQRVICGQAPWDHPGTTACHDRRSP
jgi:hypothetical protein